MMDLSDVENGLTDLREAVEAQTGGLLQMLGALANQGEMLKKQTEMLTEIRDILTTEPETESPLVEALKALAVAIESQGVTLSRIEAAVLKAAV